MSSAWNFVSVEIPHVVPRLMNESCLLKKYYTENIHIILSAGYPSLIFTSSGLIAFY